MADKPGIKTSEFGAAGAIGVLVAFNDKLAGLNSEQMWAVVVLGCVYIVSRTLVKWRTEGGSE